MKKAIINGKEVELKSRGTEIVYDGGHRMRKTVYEVAGEWRFFVNFAGEFVEVYRQSCSFSTKK